MWEADTGTGWSSLYPSKGQLWWPVHKGLTGDQRGPQLSLQALCMGLDLQIAQSLMWKAGSSKKQGQQAPRMGHPGLMWGQVSLSGGACFEHYQFPCLLLSQHQ
jgi:hypothetical protein